MQPARVVLIHAIVLILIGAWGYVSLDKANPNTLVPIGFGFIFCMAFPVLREENRIASTIVLILTFFLVIGLILLLREAFYLQPIDEVLRLVLMLGVSAYAFIAHWRYRKKIQIANKIRTP